MVRELNLISKKVAIIGAGPAGCCCAYFLQNNCDVTIFDIGSPLRTLLPTGGGRCNLANACYDTKSLAANYPRGEKFLYSVFSKFSTSDTINFFNNMGINTYIQDDMRIFPVVNSSEYVRDKFLKSLNKVTFKKQVVNNLNFNKFDYIVVAIGGHSSYSLLKGHKIISPKPSLIGLKTNNKFPIGVSIKNVSSLGFCDDIIFTHEGISGPLIYKISSINARANFPYKISLCFIDFKNNFQNLLDENSKKNIKNLLSDYLPKSFAIYILDMLDIDKYKRCSQINSKNRDDIVSTLCDFELTVTGVSKSGEVVTCGGVCLDEIDSRTMESKLIPNLYFCGEVLDIDGFCGGFNLQNCWSTAFVTAQSILSR